MSITTPLHEKTSTFSSPYQPPQTFIFRYLPSAAIPYAELMRLDRPAGFYAFYWHYVIGLSFAGAISPRASPSVAAPQLLFISSYLACWVVILRGAVCTINDNCDQDFDRKVFRTRNRPIARGAVSTFQANVFATLQLALGTLMITPLPVEAGVYAAIITLILSLYPLAKRVTDFPQVVLGFGLAMPVFLSCAAMGVDPLSQSKERLLSVALHNPLTQSMLYLYVACILWTVIFDTIYAHQDIKDDQKAGVKSLAIRLGDKTKLGCGILAAAQIGCLVQTGLLAKLSPLYFLTSCGGAALSLTVMLAYVDLNQPSSCAWWFGPGSRLVGGSLAAGLIGEYLMIHYGQGKI